MKHASFLLLALAASALAQTAALVRDLNPSTAPTDSNPQGIVGDAGAGIALFSATSVLEGTELWRSDGTDAGSVLVADINPGYRSSNPTELTWAGSTLFFVADDGEHGAELWRSDGTAAGTSLVIDLRPGSESSNPSGLTAFNGALTFFADDGTGLALWQTDGTASGTSQLANGFSGLLDPVAGGSTLFFGANQPSTGWELWKSDGTPAGTRLVDDLAPGAASGWSPVPMVTHAGVAYFSGDPLGGIDPQLWKSDGTLAGTVEVKQINGVDGGARPGQLTEIGGELFFFCTSVSGSSGDLCQSNGSAGNLTAPVLGNPNTFGPSALTSSGNELFYGFGAPVDLYARPLDGGAAIGVAFAAVTELAGFNSGVLAINDSAPWFFAGDGTLTQLAVSTVPAVDPSAFASIGSRALFDYDDPTHGSELWVTNGTAAGTGMLRDLAPGIASGNPNGMAAVGSTLLFAANDGTHGYQLWRSDGGTSGTFIVRIVNAGGFDPGPITPLGSFGLFSADDGVSGRELWRSDGTPAGTIEVADLSAGSSAPLEITPAGARAFFTADDGVTGRGLWVTDTTQSGTVKLNGPLDAGDPRGLFAFGSSIVFSASDPLHGREPWISDGTDAGTRPIGDLNSGTGDSLPSDFAQLGSTLLFAAQDPTHGRELWAFSDGGARVLDLVPGSASSAPSQLTSVGSTVLFSGADGLGDVELWWTDGFDAGVVANLYPTGNPLPQDLTNVDGTLFFTADDGVHGRQVWLSDGTDAGTVRLTTLAAGAAISQLTAVGANLYFAAPSGSNSVLWVSDGTAAGTQAIDGSFSSPLALTLSGSNLFFSALGTSGDRELWSLAVDGTPPEIAPILLGPISDGGWFFTDDAGYAFNVIDPESSIRREVGCDAGSVTTDTAGQVVTCTATSAGGTSAWTLTLRRDTHAPQIECPDAGVFAEATSPDGGVATFTVTAIDNLDPNPSVVASPPSGSVLPLGSNPIDATAIDEAGNTSSCQFQVQVRDTVAPLVHCPGDVSVDLGSADSAVVTLPQATATDAVDPSPVIHDSPASGSRFDRGTTTVKVTATDFSGNTSAPCTFQVVAGCQNGSCEKLSEYAFGCGGCESSGSALVLAAWTALIGLARRRRKGR